MTMKRLNLLKKIAVSAGATISGLLIATMLTASVAHATPYTGPTTEATPVPTFDSYVPTPGYPLPAPAPSDGEPDFLQGRVPNPNDNPAADVTTPYADPVNTSCYNGEIVQLRVYVHNNADQAYNDNGTGPSVAHGVNVKVAIPGSQNTTFQPKATISATNAATVNDDVTINCSGQPVTLQYVDGSASQYSFGDNQVTPLSDSIVTNGTPINSMGVPGDVWGCWNERVLVVLSVKVVIPTPTPPVCLLVNIDKKSEGLNAIVDTPSYTANDAKVTGVSINFGDGTTKTLQLSQFPYPYTYAKAGNYTITATILSSNFSPATSNGCTAMVTTSTTPTTPIVPVTPTPPVLTAQVTQLANTGPGSVVGIFAGTALVAGVGRHLYKTRRLARLFQRSK